MLHELHHAHTTVRRLVKVGGAKEFSYLEYIGVLMIRRAAMC